MALGGGGRGVQRRDPAGKLAFLVNISSNFCCDTAVKPKDAQLGEQM